jgi:hypothetical protein
MADARHQRSRAARFGRDADERDGGYALLLTALLVVPIMIASALAIDVGSWYARITQLQRAADAAALAGTIWMPDITKATDVAEDSLLKNGINPDGSSGVVVTIGPGASSTSLKVTLSEANVKGYFSSVANWTQSLTRSAEAEYYLPLPLGSPLNYFGGDASKNSAQTTTVPPSDYRTNPPTNAQQCRVASPGSGRWRNNAYSASGNTNGYPTCTWPSGVNTQIQTDRSPGFWAAVGGPGDVAAYGDAYSSVCTGSINCGAPVQGNKMYRSTGYWYVIKIPATGASTTTVSVYDASYDPNNGSSNNAGDQNHSDSTVFNTDFRIYRQDSPLDINVRTPLASSANNADGSCYWSLTNNADYLAQWRSLCTISNPAAGSTYLINVRTSQPQFRGAGVNGYAVQAVASGSTQPAVYAYGDMAMRNNVASGDATFYLAEVGPEYAGKVLTVDLWDPGDASQTAYLYPMMPSTSAPKPVRNVAQNDCTYTASPSPNAAGGSGSAGGATGSQVTTARGSDVSGQCGVRTNNGGTNLYNDEWLRLRIKVPSDYTCTKGINPETTAGSCWWGIKYNFAGAANDVTTWKAAIEGNPVHLVE